MDAVLYALACVALPAAWAIAMYYAFGWWQRRKRPPPSDEIPPIDYSI